MAVVAESGPAVAAVLEAEKARKDEGVTLKASWQLLRCRLR